MVSSPGAVRPQDRRRRAVTRAAGIGSFIEFYDFTLYGFFAGTLAALFFPEADPVAGLLSTFALFGVAFVVRPLGAVAFGHVGDRFGRKRALIVAVVLMSVSTVAVGCLPTYAIAGVGAPLGLLICRLLQGFSAGGEQSGAFVLVVEHAPVAERTRRAAPVVAALVAGVLTAVLAALVMDVTTTSEQLTSWGWRIPFLVAGPLGLLGLYLRMHAEDSPEYRAAKAEQQEEKDAQLPLARAFRTAWRPMLVLFGWVAMQSVAGYLLVGFMLSNLTKFHGYSLTKALVVLVIAHVVAVAALPPLGRALDHVTRKQSAVGLSLATAAWAMPAFLLLNGGTVLAVVALSVFAVLAYATILVSAVAVVELFPVETRYSASAVPFQVAYVLFGGTAPFLATLLSANVSLLAVPGWVVVMGIVGAIVGALGIRNVAGTGTREGAR
jgi:MHS family proline/betaine transporter-like MFS transporter